MRAPAATGRKSAMGRILSRSRDALDPFVDFASVSNARHIHDFFCVIDGVTR